VTGRVTYPDGRTAEMPLVARIDTVDEVAYFKSGGILQHVLRHLAAA
jgi:aconitate hydratase